MTILGMIGDYAWQLQPGGNVISNVSVPNLKFVVHFLLWVTILGMVGDPPNNDG